MTTSQRWKNRPEGSNWGDFGPDDQIGRLNLLTPEKVRQGVAEVREGLAFCLSLPLDYPGGNILNPRRHPPVLRPTVRNGRPNMNYRLGDDDPNVTDVICDDLVILHTAIFDPVGQSRPCRPACSMPTATANRKRSTTTASARTSMSGDRAIRRMPAGPISRRRAARRRRRRSGSRRWRRPASRDAAS